MPGYITADDLKLAIGPDAFLAIFDDDADGIADAGAVAQVLEMSAAEIDSVLLGVWDSVVPAESPVPIILKSIALDFAVALSYERHPEYSRRYGDDARKTLRWGRASQRLKDVQNGILMTSTGMPREVPSMATSAGSSDVTGLAMVTAGGDCGPGESIFWGKCCKPRC